MTQAYVFDAYGTLFDVHSAVRKHADSVGPDADLVSDVWRQKQLEYSWTRTLMDRYLDFWDLTEQALDFALAKVPTANKDAKKKLLDAYWHLECFDEVPTVLTKLKETGKKVAILSNGSSGMLLAAVKSAGLSDLVDDCISVDRIGRFKAVPAVYQMVLDDYQISAHDVSFQSSNRWDIAAASAFGFQTVWCNRGDQPDEYSDLPPDRIVSDLNALIT
jgi:2-haloacid dehalogenase